MRLRASVAFSRTSSPTTRWPTRPLAPTTTNSGERIAKAEPDRVQHAAVVAVGARDRITVANRRTRRCRVIVLARDAVGAVARIEIAAADADGLEVLQPVRQLRDPRAETKLHAVIERGRRRRDRQRGRTSGRDGARFEADAPAEQPRLPAIDLFDTAPERERVVHAARAQLPIGNHLRFDLAADQ